MELKTKKMGFAVAAAASMLIAGCATNQDTSHGADMKGQCHGVNSCKGTSKCATADSACAGQNSCKGKGWLPMAKSECEAQGGRFQGFNDR